MKIGERYYVITHAYHHVLGKVSEILTAGRYKLSPCLKVHGCGRGWEKFFEDGLGNDTRFDRLPDGVIVGSECLAIPWNHPIPGE